MTRNDVNDVPSALGSSGAALPPMTGAIFDCDGTLLDSLQAWSGVEGELARAARVQVTPEEHTLFATYTIPEVSAYFHRTYGLGASPAAVTALIDDYIMDYYQHRARALPGVAAFLEACAQRGVVMSVASSSPSIYLEAGLKAAGIRSFFTAVISAEDLQTTKREPLVYQHAAQQMGSNLATTWGFEDSLYAMDTLLAAKFPTVGVHEPREGISFEELVARVDVAIRSFEELSIAPDGRLTVE